VRRIRNITRFGQEQGFDEYQTIVPHPDLPVDGHNAVKSVKTEKKALRKMGTMPSSQRKLRRKLLRRIRKL
jgi:hypothetical protein